MSVEKIKKIFIWLKKMRLSKLFILWRSKNKKFILFFIFLFKIRHLIYIKINILIFVLNKSRKINADERKLENSD